MYGLCFFHILFSYVLMLCPDLIAWPSINTALNSYTLSRNEVCARDVISILRAIF